MNEQDLINKIEQLEYELELYKSILQKVRTNKLTTKKSLKNNFEKIFDKY